MFDLSPEAEKAQQEAQARARRFAPTLARTGIGAVIFRPQAYRGGRAARDFATWIKATLPQFTFDARRDCWLAPLDQLDAAHHAMTDRGTFCNVTNGARQELDRLHQVANPDRTLPTVDLDGQRVIIKRPAQSVTDFDVLLYSALPTALYDSRIGAWSEKAENIARIVKVLKKRLGGCNLTPSAEKFIKESRR